jgi:hypothetical protein
LVQARLILDQDYVDIDAHVVADLAGEQLGDAAGAKREHDIVVGLLRSIRTGDGSSPAQAFTPISVGEEYAVMRAFDMKVSDQALIQAAGHSYDKLDVTDADGKTLSFYFLIDRICRRISQNPSPARGEGFSISPQTRTTIPRSGACRR